MAIFWFEENYEIDEGRHYKYLKSHPCKTMFAKLVNGKLDSNIQEYDTLNYILSPEYALKAIGMSDQHIKKYHPLIDF